MQNPARIFLCLLISIGCTTSVVARTNYYGGTDDPSASDNYRYQTCLRAEKNLPIYERRMRHFCNIDPTSTMCRSYKDLFDSWSRIRIKNCQKR